MIYPRLNRARNGQRLSVGLVNGLIKRTEYAADLLQQYKLLAGTNTEVAQSYDGTRVDAIINNDGTNPNNPLTLDEALSYYDPDAQKTVPNNATKIYFSMSSFTPFTLASTYMFDVSFADGVIRRAGDFSGGDFYYTTGFDVNRSGTRPNYSGFVTSVEFLFEYPPFRGSLSFAVLSEFI